MSKFSLGTCSSLMEMKMIGGWEIITANYNVIKELMSYLSGSMSQMKISQNQSTKAAINNRQQLGAIVHSITIGISTYSIVSSVFQKGRRNKGG